MNQGVPHLRQLLPPFPWSPKGTSSFGLPVIRLAPSEFQVLWLRAQCQCHGQDGRNSPPAALKHSRNNRNKAKSMPQGKKRDVDYQVIEKKKKNNRLKKTRTWLLLMKRREAASPTSLDEAAQRSTLMVGSLPQGTLYFSTQKIQVQALLIKFLSGMVPSQA